MKSVGILQGFVPLVVYGLLAGSSVTSVIVALGAAMIITVIIGFSDLTKGMILTWANLVLFSSLLIAVGILGMSGLLPVMGMLIYAALAAVTFGSILAKIPFTLQYAREMVDRTLQEKPAFIRVNILMTGVWGAIFLINFILDYLAFAYPHSAGGITLPLTYLVLIAGIIFTIWYPGHIRKKYASASAQSGT